MVLLHLILLMTMQCMTYISTILHISIGHCGWMCNRPYSQASYILNCMLAELITLEECIEGTQYVLCKALVSYNAHKLLHDNRPKTHLERYSVATLAEKWTECTQHATLADPSCLQASSCANLFMAELCRRTCSTGQQQNRPL